MTKLLSLDDLYKHWQGHRRLTIRTLETFPEEQLFNYYVDGMRSFGEMVGEMIGVENYTLKGILSGNWEWQQDDSLDSKSSLLAALKQLELESKERWSQLTLEQVEAVEKDGWGMTWANRERLLYMIENEIHHRAQGYVYLRLLGNEPPVFWER